MKILQVAFLLLFNYLDSLPKLYPITSREIRLQVERDPVLSRVYHWVMHGWTMHDVKDPDFKPYFK